MSFHLIDKILALLCIIVCYTIGCVLIDAYICKSSSCELRINNLPFLGQWGDAYLNYLIQTPFTLTFLIGLNVLCKRFLFGGFISHPHFDKDSDLLIKLNHSDHYDFDAILRGLLNIDLKENGFNERLALTVLK